MVQTNSLNIIPHTEEFTLFVLLIAEGFLILNDNRLVGYLDSADPGVDPSGNEEAGPPQQPHAPDRGLVHLEPGDGLPPAPQVHIPIFTSRNNPILD